MFGHDNKEHVFRKNKGRTDAQYVEMLNSFAELVYDAVLYHLDSQSSVNVDYIFHHLSSELMSQTHQSVFHVSSIFHDMLDQHLIKIVEINKDDLLINEITYILSEELANKHQWMVDTVEICNEDINKDLLVDVYRLLEAYSI